MASFYAYLWLREDRTPYYAGKGCGNRAFIKGIGHRQYPPADRSRIVLFPAASENAAFDLERALIRFFGRKDRANGCLRNVTEGGEGTSGYRHTPTARARMAQVRLGNHCGVGATRSAEFKKNLSTKMLGKKWSAEALAKRVATRRKNYPSYITSIARSKKAETDFLKTVAWG